MLMNYSADKLQIKTATPMEWQSMVKIAHKEHWDLGNDDNRLFFTVDPAGFFIAFFDGIPAAYLSIVNYTDDYSHLGNYLVAPQFRGQGLGVALWQFSIPHAKNRCIGLDGMPEQTNNYQQWGFKTHYKTFRMQGYSSKHTGDHHNIQAINQHNILSIIQHDANLVGYSRHNLLKEWFFGEMRSGLVLSDDSQINGIIGWRRSDTGYRIGPFYAKDKQHIEILLLAAFSAIPEKTTVTLDIPEYAHSCMELITLLGFKEILYTYRMYRGEPPLHDKSPINALTSLELG